MISHRSRRLVQLCNKSEPQDKNTKPTDHQEARSPAQIPIAPIVRSDPQTSTQIDCFDQTQTSPVSLQPCDYADLDIDNNSFATELLSTTGVEQIFEFTVNNNAGITEITMINSQMPTSPKTVRQLENVVPIDMASSDDLNLIQLSDLVCDEEQTHVSQEDEDYLPGLSDSSSSDSSMGDLENPVQEVSNSHNPEKDNNDPEVFYGNMSEGRKRKKKAEPQSWKKNLNKKLRMQGKPYLGYEAPRGQKIQHNKNRPARSIGPRCTSDFCKNSAVRRCDDISEETRQKMFETFWDSMDWSQRKVYVGNNVTVVGKKRATTSGPSRRGGTLKYFLTVMKEDNTTERYPVCRSMFLNTLCLGTFTVQSWAKKSQSGMFSSEENKNRSRNMKPNQGRSAQLLILEEFLDTIPKLPSHYNRKDTNKLYIEPIFRNITHLFDIYKKFCTDKDCSPVSRKKFDQVFSDKNIAIHKLKKDMCDTCLTYQNGNMNEDKYQQHILRKELARKEKEKDKNDALQQKCILLNVDLQAVKVCPFLTASAVYYKTKLTLHNYTVYNLTSHHTKCYWFAETEADLSSSTFASMLIDYLEKHCVLENTHIPIIIYSDGCAAQNRNNILANALLNFSIRHNLSVYQKYLEVGHTQMEGDSVHSCIERKLKNRTINLPSDYVTATKEARKKPFPYEAVMLQYGFFLNYADSQTWRYTSIRPGRKAGDPKVTDVKAIAYIPDGWIKVKLDHSSEWQDLPQRPKRLSGESCHYNQLHTKQIPLQESKFKHLQELKTLLPLDCQSFYDSLPHL